MGEPPLVSLFSWSRGGWVNGPTLSWYFSRVTKRIRKRIQGQAVVQEKYGGRAIDSTVWSGLKTT